MKPLRVLSWAGAWGRALTDEVSRPFTEATGIAVEHVRHVGLRLPEGLRDALENGARPPVDVVWCNTAPVIRAADRGWCAPLDGLEVLGELAERARPPGRDDWPFVQAYAVHYVLVYRKALYPTAPPRSWNVLLRPEHAGRVVLYPGGKGFLPVAQVLGGGKPSTIPDDMDACWSVVRRMRPQLGRPDYSIGLGEPIRRGEIDLCYRALPNALGFMAEGVDVEWTVPEEGVADTTDALWVPRGVDDETAEHARRYVAFAMSAGVQERWCGALGAVPLHPRAAVPALLRRAGGPLTRDLLPVAAEVEARWEADWERTFDATIGA